MNIKYCIHIILKSIKKIYICYKKGFPFSVALLCDVCPENIPKSTIFGHPFGIVIRENTVIGENCTIRQNVTIGQRRYENDTAKIGDNVEIGAGAIILGDVSIGNNVIIGAGSIILASIPDNKTVVGLWK